MAKILAQYGRMKNVAVRISAIGIANTVATKSRQTTGMTITKTKPIPRDIHGLSLGL